MGISESVDVLDDTIVILGESLTSMSGVRRRGMMCRLWNITRQCTEECQPCRGGLSAGGGSRWSLSAQRSQAASRAEGDSWTVQAFLRWNLFDGLKREHERSKAKLKMSETEERLAFLKKAVSFRVYEAYLNDEEARKTEELAASALRTAEEGKRLVDLNTITRSPNRRSSRCSDESRPNRERHILRAGTPTRWRGPI